MSSSAALQPLSQEAVCRYLETHPEFFQKKPDLLASMVLPGRTSVGAGVADFQNFQISHLKARLQAQAEQLDGYVDTVRGNEGTLSGVQQAVLSLLTCRSLADLWACVSNRWAAQLDILVATLAVEKPKGRALPKAFAALPVVPGDTIARLYGNPLPSDTQLAIVLSDKTTSSRFLFGGQGLEVQSDALLALPASAHLPGLLLAFGGAAPGHFSPDQGTDLLYFLGRAFGEMVDVLHSRP